MTSSAVTKEELIETISQVLKRFRDFIMPMDDGMINQVPYEGSWTTGQVYDHITKSNNGLSRSLQTPSKPADRDPEARIPELKKVFLDFTHKMKSPDFIIPGNGPFEKQAVISRLDKSLQNLKDNAKDADIKDLIEGLPLGPITKLEILRFIGIHIERHIHQMEKITTALKN
jgi:hypothetical protein